MRRKEEMPVYHKVTKNGTEYLRTQFYTEDGKRHDVYGHTVEELKEKLPAAKRRAEERIVRAANPTVAEYSMKWLKMHSANLMPSTAKGYEHCIRNHIIKPLGELLMAEVTADDLKLALVPVSKLSSGTYNLVNMLVKSIFASAEYSRIIEFNPAKNLNPRGGTPGKERVPLTDEQVRTLLDTIEGLPPQLFVMLGLYAGLRREEILALQWDCVHLDEQVPYISVRRAWRPDQNPPTISTVLKTKAAKRDIPIPRILADRLREEKARSKSDFVISNSEGGPLSETQFVRVWNYIKVRSTHERKYYKYVNGEKITQVFYPVKGSKCKNNPRIIYCIDFHVSPHILRHTYITNLIHAGVDPKTVQYLAGHENSKTTMDIYAKVKYNRPEELSGIINAALKGPGSADK